MKTNLLRRWAALACLGLSALVVRAQPAAPVADKQATAAPAAVTPAATSSTTPAAADSAAAVPASAETARNATTPANTSAAPAPAATSSTSSSEMRRLDQPAGADTSTPARPASAARKSPVRRASGNERVAIASDSHLAKGETAGAVVAVFGNATSEGEVSDSVVSVLGNSRATGPVGDSVVAVLGNVYVDSKVGEVVAVLGNVDLGPNAEVMGDVVAVGGVMHRDPKAVIHGDSPTVGVNFGGFNVEWLQSYVTECLFKFRLLGFTPHLGWAWGVAIGFLLFYVVLALLFRGGVDKCVQTLETRPGGSILAAVLAILLTPVLIVLLCVTVVGLAVVPFVGLALLIASLFGKVTMLAWLGRRITRLFGNGAWSHPAVGVFIAGVIVLGLYTVPIVSLLVYKLMGVLGVGVVVYTVLLATKREKRVPAAASASPFVPPVMPEAGMSGGGGGVAVAEPAVAVVPPAVALTTLPRAGFWIRMGALAIDVILVGLILMIARDILPRAVHVHFGSSVLLVLAAYAAALWKTKGTTIGGIICGLRVVRLDQRPVDWSTACVRALGCFLSLVVIGLGFIWVAVDDDKQSWHDKIAGTVVVHARGAVTLV